MKKGTVLYFLIITILGMAAWKLLATPSPIRPRIKQISDTSNTCQQPGVVNWRIFNSIDGATLKEGRVVVLHALPEHLCYQVVRAQMFHEILVYLSEHNVLEDDGSLPPVSGASTILSASATLDFPAISSGSGCDDLTISVPGAAEGDAVALAPPAGFASPRSTFNAWVSSTGTVKVRHCAHGGTPDPGSGAYSVRVLK